MIPEYATKYSFKDEKMFFELLFDKFKVKKGVALDIGCGFGFFTNLLEMMGHNIFGLDLDFKTINEASKSYKSKFLVADGKKPPFAQNTFDLILCKGISTFNSGNVVEASEQRDVILEMLKIGGVLVFIHASDLTGKKTKSNFYWKVNKVSALFAKPETEVWTYFFFAKNRLLRLVGSKGFNPVFMKLSTMLTKITKRTGYIVCIIRKLK